MKTKKNIITTAAIFTLSGFSLLATSCGPLPGPDLAGMEPVEFREKGPRGKGQITSDPLIYVHHTR